MTFFDYLPPLVLAGALLYGVLAQFVPLPGKRARVEPGDGPRFRTTLWTPRHGSGGRNRKDGAL